MRFKERISMETAKGRVFCNISNKNRQNCTNIGKSYWEQFPTNSLGSPLLPGTSSFLIWEVEQGENSAKEGQTPITSGLFSLAPPRSSPLVILHPIVIFTLEILLTDYKRNILFLKVCGLDCLMGLLHLTSVIFVFRKYLTPCFPFHLLLQIETGWGET